MARGWALVFSGQGQQHPQMLGWLQPDASLRALDEQLGADWRAQLACPGLVGNNRRAQLLLTACGCAAWSQLRALLGPPAIVAGYSVGELPAHVAAGVFDAPTALRLAAHRAEFMDAAARGTGTGLLGLTGATAAGLQALCAQFALDIAIRIDPGSAVLGGLRVDLQAAADAATDRGWRCTPLPVDMASHTAWMQPAAAAFADVLAQVRLADPQLPLCSNALVRVRRAADAARGLASQIAQTVRWDECMDAIAAQGVGAVLEIGPGQALTRIWRERYPDVPARSADEFRSADAIAAWLNRQLDSCGV